MKKKYRASFAFFLTTLTVSLSVPACQRPDPKETAQDSSQDVSGAEETSHTALISDPNQVLPGAHNDWKIWLGGWGKVEIGHSLTQVRKTLPFAIDSMTDPEPGQECFVLIPADAPESYAFMFVGEGDKAKLVRIFIDVSGIRTISGISIGSSEADVRKAYGPKIKEETHKYVEGWKQLIFVPSEESDKHLRLVFTSDGTRVQQISVGRLPEILDAEACN
ncbi:MAG: hypothetical protein CMN76_02815 [Spirochaetaceae bacterium]|nr:hypothetical protein [Spirochaetaceae bacterium]|tara:strand:+ start:5878 stop:6537 length:660 start_codon:yes stop_codon:yes gene_type:complete